MSNNKSNLHYNDIDVSKVQCESDFEPGVSGLPYYCTPSVYVPDVLGGLAVWQHINQKHSVPLVGPHEEPRAPSGCSLGGFTLSSGREAK